MISIIITSYKEPRTIGKAIEQVLKNNLKDYEILVTAPDKETLDAAKVYSKKNKNIRLIMDNGKGKPAALNMIFKKAKGNILVLTDGDIFIKEDSIKPLLEWFKDEKIGAVTGKTIALDDRNTLLGYWAHLLNHAANLQRQERYNQGKFIFCSGYLFAMRKGIVKEMPTNILDDAYISSIIWKKGYKIGFEPDSIVYIKHPLNFKDWILQKRRNTAGHKQIKELVNIPMMKSFKNEVSGTFMLLKYPRTIKEVFYTLLLFPSRLYLWILAFYDQARKKTSKDLWKRVESTK
jgi:cellulose synthase/poly-beta-1,6-N-acetylglucosamine synthase-like glycosyltransferase